MSALKNLIKEYTRRSELRRELERPGGSVDQMLHAQTKVSEGPSGRHFDVRDPADLFAVLSPPFMDLEVRISDDCVRVVNNGALIQKMVEIAPFLVRELADRHAPLPEETEETTEEEQD